MVSAYGIQYFASHPFVSQGNIVRKRQPISRLKGGNTGAVLVFSFGGGGGTEGVDERGGGSRDNNN